MCLKFMCPFLALVIAPLFQIRRLGLRPLETPCFLGQNSLKIALPSTSLVVASLSYSSRLAAGTLHRLDFCKIGGLDSKPRFTAKRGFMSLHLSYKGLQLEGIIVSAGTPFKGFEKGLAGGGWRQTKPQKEPQKSPEMCPPSPKGGIGKRVQKLSPLKDFLAPTPNG